MDSSIPGVAVAAGDGLAGGPNFRRAGRDGIGSRRPSTLPGHARKCRRRQSPVGRPLGPPRVYAGQAGSRGPGGPSPGARGRVPLGAGGDERLERSGLRRRRPLGAGDRRLVPPDLAKPPASLPGRRCRSFRDRVGATAARGVVHQPHEGAGRPLPGPVHRPRPAPAPPAGAADPGPAVAVGGHLRGGGGRTRTCVEMLLPTAPVASGPRSNGPRGSAAGDARRGVDPSRPKPCRWWTPPRRGFTSCGGVGGTFA